MSEAEEVYKIFVIEKEELRNLFRGIDGTRTIPFDSWLRAENKWSVDSSNQDPYLTGIHVLKEKDIAINYLKTNFRKERERVIVKCLAKDLRPKPTNSKVFLADWLYVPEESFEERIEVEVDYSY